MLSACSSACPSQALRNSGHFGHAALVFLEAVRAGVLKDERVTMDHLRRSTETDQPGDLVVFSATRTDVSYTAVDQMAVYSFEGLLAGTAEPDEAYADLGIARSGFAFDARAEVPSCL